METFALLYTHLKSKEVRISPVYLKSGLVGPACFKHIDLRQDEFESYVRTPRTDPEEPYTQPTLFTCL